MADQLVPPLHIVDGVWNGLPGFIFDDLINGGTAAGDGGELAQALKREF